MLLDLSKGFTPKSDIGVLTSKGINADFVALFFVKALRANASVILGIGLAWAPIFDFLGISLYDVVKQHRFLLL